MYYRFLLLLTLLSIAACARGDEGSSFERPQTFLLGENDGRLIDAQDIVISPKQTVLVFTSTTSVPDTVTGFRGASSLTESPADRFQGLTACDAGSTGVVNVKKRGLKGTSPCENPISIGKNPEFSFQSDLGLEEPVFFSLDLLFPSSLPNPNTRHAIVLARAPKRGNFLLIEGPTTAIRFKSGGINIIGDPFNPDNDPVAIADAIRKKVPNISPDRIVVGEKVSVTCAEDDVTFSGILGDRTVPGVRCDVIP